MRDGFAKWEIKNSVFSKEKPQAGNCWLLARSRWQIDSWGSLLSPSATTLPRPERYQIQDVYRGWSRDPPAPDKEVPLRPLNTPQTPLRPCGVGLEKVWTSAMTWPSNAVPVPR